MAVNNSVWYANYGNGSSTGYFAVPVWSTGAVKAVGNRVRQLAAPAVTNERVWICIIAGTTHATTEPVWNVGTQGSRTTDNTVTWQEVTGKPAVNGDTANTPLSSSARSNAVVLGNIVRNNTSTHFFICSTAGTTGAGEPAYNTTTGGTTTDGGCTWTCIGAVGSFAAWAAPVARLAGAWVNAAGDTIYVSSAHAETQAAAMAVGPATLTSFLCIADAGTIPPTAADLTTGASCTTTGNSALTINGITVFQGIAFFCGTGAFGTLFNVSTGVSTYVSMRNCALNLRATAGQTLIFGNNTGSKVELWNTTIGFSGGAGDIVSFRGSQFLWRDTASALSAVGGTWPTQPFQGTTNGATLFENLDLSAFAGTSYWNPNTGPVKAVMARCKLAAIAIAQVTAAAGHLEIDVIDCDAGALTYRHERWLLFEGTQFADAVVVRTLGASDGTTPYSWRLVSNPTTRWQLPFESLPIAVWNAVTGSNVTVTLEGIWSSTVVPTNDEIWIGASYFGTAGSTLGSRVSSTKATPITAAANLPASTAAWDSKATARANGTVYALGNLIKLASNPGRLFICTVAGTSAGSEPAGYASAVDGGVVVDNSATFRAMVRFRLQAVLTGPAPQIAGLVYVRVRVGRVSSTYYVDPKVTLT